MEYMINEAQSDQSIHIEQIDHGRFASISSTSLLLMVGAFGPALKAGSPVTGSVTNFCSVRTFSSRRQHNSSILDIRVQRITWPNIKSAAQRPLAERLVPWSIVWFAW